MPEARPRVCGKNLILPLAVQISAPFFVLITDSSATDSSVTDLKKRLRSRPLWNLQGWAGHGSKIRVDNGLGPGDFGGVPLIDSSGTRTGYQ